MMNHVSGLVRCALLFAASSVLAFAQATNLPAWYVFQHEHVLGTSLELKFSARMAAQADAAEAAALAEIDRLGKILSGYDATSEFSRWFETRGEPVRVSPELFAVLALFDTWRERTGGALDASAEVAGRLWKTAAQRQRVPSSEELAAAVASAQRLHWRLDAAAGTATHLTDAPLRLNSFAKSYIIDRACTAALAAGHLATAVVNLGGDLVVRGAEGDAIAIADPAADAENDLPLTQIAVRDRAVATSGGYRRGVEIEGHWYSHLVDPRTGRPVDQVQSATVVAPSATDAGALATALCVLSADEGLRLVASRREVECLLVTGDGRRLASAGWKTFETQPTPTAFPGVHAAAAKSGGANSATAAGGDPAFEVVINLEIANVTGGRARRPYVAVWIEDKDNFPVRTVALWFKGPRWLPDLRSWYRADQMRAMAEGTQITHSVSSATRGSGKYTLKWDGKDQLGKPVPPGKYMVMIEAAREHGTHQLVHADLETSGTAQHVNLPANVELASISVDYRRKAAAR